MNQLLDFLVNRLPLGEAWVHRGFMPPGKFSLDRWAIQPDVMTEAIRLVDRVEPGFSVALDHRRSHGASFEGWPKACRANGLRIRHRDHLLSRGLDALLLLLGARMATMQILHSPLDEVRRFVYPKRVRRSGP